MGYQLCDHSFRQRRHGTGSRFDDAKDLLDRACTILNER